MPAAPRRPASRALARQQHTDAPFFNPSIQSTTTDPTPRRNLFAPSMTRRGPITGHDRNMDMNPVLEDNRAGAGAGAAAGMMARVGQQQGGYGVDVDLDSDEDIDGEDMFPDVMQNRHAIGLAAASSSFSASTARGRGGSQTSRTTTAAAGRDKGRDIVFRDGNGDFIHEVPLVGEHVEDVEDEREAEDARLTALARELWANGGGLQLGGRGSKKLGQDELERNHLDIMARLRESVAQHLADDKWMFEETDCMETLKVVSHGRQQ